jgi:hypothetical protein
MEGWRIPRRILEVGELEEDPGKDELKMLKKISR